MNPNKIIETYEIAKERYSELGVDTAQVLKVLEKISLSIHCWQGDDVGGFEKPNSKVIGGGIMATGNYLGKATSISELQLDLAKVMSLTPGSHRVNLHAIYGDFGEEYVDRDKIEVKHFQTWIDWAKREGLGLDFNPTLFLSLIHI